MIGSFRLLDDHYQSAQLAPYHLIQQASYMRQCRHLGGHSQCFGQLRLSHQSQHRSSSLIAYRYRRLRSRLINLNYQHE